MEAKLKQAINKIVKVTFESKHYNGTYQMTGVVTGMTGWRVVFDKGFETNYPGDLDPDRPTTLLIERVRSVEVLTVACTICPMAKMCPTFQNATTLPTKCHDKLKFEAENGLA